MLTCRSNLLIALSAFARRRFIDEDSILAPTKQSIIMQDNYSYVYILTNFTNKVLYVGCTGRELKERIWQHKEKAVDGFTKRYNVNKLVYFELFEDLEVALNREVQIKGGSRANKIKLISGLNPTWKDLYEYI